METAAYSVKVSVDIKQKVRNFCAQHGIQQAFFVEKALEEKLEREETVQDILEFKRWQYQEPQALSFEQYVKQRNVRS